MRAIKFRGKTKDGHWVYGVPIKNGFGGLAFMCLATIDNLSCPMEKIHKFFIEVIPETVTEFTAGRDNDGVEVYEGDIIQIKGIPCTFEVVYRIGSPSRWVFNPQMPSDLTFSMGGLEPGKGYRMEKITVLGNKFDDPELFKVSDKLFLHAGYTKYWRCSEFEPWSGSSREIGGTAYESK